jgi:hypothetical protein
MKRKREAPKIINEAYELADVAKLRLHPENPRRGQIDQIEENGMFGAVVVQRSTGFILKGNHTYQAAKKKGLAQVPTIYVDVDDDRARRIMLVDNKTSDDATNDDELLNELLRDLEKTENGLLGTGYDDAPEEEETELKAITIAKPPNMTWVLVGIPTVRFGEISEKVEEISARDEVFCEVTANSTEVE